MAMGTKFPVSITCMVFVVGSLLNSSSIIKPPISGTVELATSNVSTAALDSLSTRRSGINRMLESRLVINRLMTNLEQIRVIRT